MTGDDIPQRLDNQQFNALEDEVDRLAAQASDESTSGGAELPNAERFDPASSDEGFDELVRSALDDLPEEVLVALNNVVIIVSDDGRKRHAYGLYQGHQQKGWNIATPVQRALPDQITIFRDTLVRDFGHDPARLRAQVAKTVRHEVAHHLGFDEREVHRLGL
jgi:predicted Zn-dependent protease with MMP-like domain